jgi:hypothetical protein
MDQPRTSPRMIKDIDPKNSYLGWLRSEGMVGVHYNRQYSILFRPGARTSRPPVYIARKKLIKNIK